MIIIIGCHSKPMEEGQNILALMMKKKRAEGSLDMPVKKKKKKKQKKVQEELPPEPEGELIVTVVEPPLQENQFFDDACKQADENLNKQPQDFGKKIKKLSGVMARLHASVLQMKSRYNDIDLQELFTKRPNKRKIARARAFVKSQIASKQKFEHKIEGIKEKEKKSKQQQEEQAKIEEAKAKQKQLEQMKKEWEERKKRKQKQAEENAKRIEKAKKMVEQHQGGEYLYEKMQKHQVRREKNEQLAHQAYLKKRSQQFKSLELSELQQHIKAHNDHIRDAITLKQQEIIERHHQLAQQNLKLLEKIYRGRNYEKAQQQSEEQKMLRLKSKEQRQKIRKYAEYVRQNFKPELKQEDEEDNQMGESRDNVEEGEQQEDEEKKEEKYPKLVKVKRYKFLQGKSCGEVIETVKAPLSERLQRRLGNGYLQHVYALPKKKPGSSSPKPEQSDTSLQQSRQKPKIEVPVMPRPKHFSVRISETPNRKQISNMLQLLKSKDSQLQLKQKYLVKSAGNRVNFEANNASLIHDDIISNIERKLSLLHQL